MKRVLDLDPATYRRHMIHGEGRSWAETNCYADVLIELLHAMRFEPIAALPFTLRIDFEGDQWTFFKFPHGDLLTLFALDIQEMNPWRSLVHHVEEQIGQERPVLVELDSYYLPDTAGTAYQLAHVKSTVAVNEIDLEACHMDYPVEDADFRASVEAEIDQQLLRLQRHPCLAAYCGGSETEQQAAMETGVTLSS